MAQRPQQAVTPIKTRLRTMNKTNVTNLPIFFLPTQLLIHVQ